MQDTKMKLEVARLFQLRKNRLHISEEITQSRKFLMDGFHNLGLIKLVVGNLEAKIGWNRILNLSQDSAKEVLLEIIGKSKFGDDFLEDIVSEATKISPSGLSNLVPPEFKNKVRTSGFQWADELERVPTLQVRRFKI